MENKEDYNDRKMDRLDVYWKVYYGRSIWGYVLDLSDSGIRLWLNKDFEIKEDDFIIKIRPPFELKLGDVDFDVHRVWEKTHQSISYNEVGCQFSNLSGEQKELLQIMIDYFKRSTFDSISG